MSEVVCVKELVAEVLATTYTNIIAKEQRGFAGFSESAISSRVAMRDEDAYLEEDSAGSCTEGEDGVDEDEESDALDSDEEVEEESQEEEDASEVDGEEAQDSGNAEQAYVAAEYQMEDEDEAIVRATIASLESDAQNYRRWNDEEDLMRSASASSTSAKDYANESKGGTDEDDELDSQDEPEMSETSSDEEQVSDDSSQDDRESASDTSDSEKEQIFHKNRFAALAPSEDEDDSVSSRSSDAAEIKTSKDATQDASPPPLKPHHVKVHNCGGLVGHMTESMQKGLNKAKAKSELQSMKMSKGFAYAEKKAKGMAVSTRKQVTAFFKTNMFRFGAESEAKSEA